ncbi:response regulator transcription factor [Plantactinospora sp. B5E13]|uniref:response regulator transcription factor n=1 Tax=unclassified Plantactinospora TaxID=2631981 RepID=UPI00325E5BAA
MRVLIVEDERVLADYVAAGLRRQAMAVDVAHDGRQAQEFLLSEEYDIVILDRGLPGVHGDEICRSLARDGSRARILMLTAAGALGDRVAGLRLGADDYLVKPFEFEELAARVLALGRRAVPALAPVLERRGVVLDRAHWQASRDGRPLALSPKEFAVLEVLMRAQGAVVSAETLLEQAWDANADPFTSAVRITMSKLRAKLGDPPLIETISGVGYRI